MDKEFADQTFQRIFVCGVGLWGMWTTRIIIYCFSVLKRVDIESTGL